MPHIILTSPNSALFLNQKYHCYSGKNGIKHDKVEGDGTTPIGVFPLRRVFYRADRVQKPITHLQCYPISPEDGWCDDPSDSQRYNTFISLPHTKSHEKLWRDDHVYDLIIEVGYNDDPITPGKGSAIFIHLKRPEQDPKNSKNTEGCLAFSYEDLIKILSQLTPDSCLIVAAPNESI